MLLTIHHESGYRRCGSAFTSCRGSCFLRSRLQLWLLLDFAWKRLLTKLHAMRFQILRVWDFRVVLLTFHPHVSKLTRYNLCVQNSVEINIKIVTLFEVHLQCWKVNWVLKEIRFIILKWCWNFNRDMAIEFRNITKAISSSAQLSLI